MKFKQILAVLLTSSFPILLLNNSANAFNLIYKKSPTTDAFYDPGNGKLGYLYINDIKKLERPNRKSEFW